MMGLGKPKKFRGNKRKKFVLKAMLHGAIFLATCNAILLLRDVKLPSTSLQYIPLMFSEHIENSSSKTFTFVHYKHLFCKLNSRIPILKVNILFNLQIKYRKFFTDFTN
jgi:hypothetical protein